MVHHAVKAQAGKRLTRREIQILDGMARGLTAAQISREVAVQPSSVHTFRARIRAKLGAVNAPHAVALGFAKGYLQVRQAVSHGR